VQGGDNASSNCGQSSSGHAYFQSLLAHPSLWDSGDLRSQASINDWADKNEGGTYSSSRDAMRQRVPANETSMNQMRHLFPTPLNSSASGNLLVTWETLFEAGWAQGGEIDGVIDTYKAFQFSGTDGGTYGGLHFELRFKFGDAAPDRVAQLDVRPYEDAPTGDPTYGSGSMAQRKATFNVREETWTRFWVYFDFDQNNVTYWVGDRQSGPVLLYDRVPYSNSAGILAFWYEFNTSQEGRNGPERAIFNRNWVALRNLGGGYSAAANLIQVP
jgi:hypothetical protein